MIEVEPLTAAIGAEVRGLDLRKALTAADRDAVHDALMRHLVLFFRDQPVTPEQQLAFAAEFGPIQLGSAAAVDDDLEKWFVTLVDGPDAEPKADRWHTDVPFYEQPPDIAVLTMPGTIIRIAEKANSKRSHRRIGRRK